MADSVNCRGGWLAFQQELIYGCSQDSAIGNELKGSLTNSRSQYLQCHNALSTMSAAMSASTLNRLLSSAHSGKVIRVCCHTRPTDDGKVKIVKVLIGGSFVHQLLNIWCWIHVEESPQNFFSFISNTQVDDFFDAQSSMTPTIASMAKNAPSISIEVLADSSLLFSAYLIVLSTKSYNTKRLIALPTPYAKPLVRQ
uniref:Uncharacterized protein n=1 Tax=Romanomermis culicivorax TaxID=13658 RepID=A0A915JAA3_ROMCU